MIWLYRLQQRLSITRREGVAVLTLMVLFVTGLTVQHWKRRRVPPLSPDSLVAQPVDSSADVLPDQPGSAPSQQDAPSRQDPLNVNHASREELQTLNGIGPALSDRILEYRTTVRPFQRIQELQRVRGIGPKTLADLRPTITVASTPDDEATTTSDG